MSSTYETDFHAWAYEQASLLRAGRLDAADIDNIAEEIESMGRSEKRELISRLTVLLTHLLKWRHQPGRRGTSWRLTIEIQRNRLGDHLGDNPSLRSVLPASMRSAYKDARLEASQETGLDPEGFQPECPWSFDQITAKDFWPD